MNETIRNLSMATEIKIEGYEKPLRIDFSDKGIKLRILKLMKEFQNADTEMAIAAKEAEGIEDEVDKLIFITEKEVELLTRIKDSVNYVFGTNLTDAMFGEGCLPDLERYFPLLDAIKPFAVKAAKEQAEMSAKINEKYGLNRLA